jgi:hypothetical protein
LFLKKINDKNLIDLTNLPDLTDLNKGKQIDKSPKISQISIFEALVRP